MPKSDRTTTTRQVAPRSNAPAPQVAAPAASADQALGLQGAAEQPQSASPQAMLALQRLYGNRAVGAAIQRATIGAQGGELDRGAQGAIDAARGGGQPLDAGVGAAVGGALGADFGGVRVHTDSRSDALNHTLSAKAFTTGSDLFFSQGTYQPNTASGKQLLAHELTHVVQQGHAKPNKASPEQGRSVQTKLTVGAADDAFEREAEQVSQRVAHAAPRGAADAPNKSEALQRRLAAKQLGGVKLGGHSAGRAIQRQFAGALENKSTNDVMLLLEEKYLVTVKAWKVDNLRTEKSATYNSVAEVAAKLGLKPKPGFETTETTPEPEPPSKLSQPEPTRSTPKPVPSRTQPIVESPPPTSSPFPRALRPVGKSVEPSSSVEMGQAPEGESELKVVPSPKLNKPVREGKVFSKAMESMDVEVSQSGSSPVRIALSAGQNYLNDELSQIYHDDPSAIKTGEVDYSRNSYGKYVLGGGHHRFLWMSHHNKPVKAALNKKLGTGGEPWTGMTYKKDPKKKELPAHMATGEPLEDTPAPVGIETENLDLNPTANTLREKWKAIDWGVLKKPRLVFSTPEEKLTTTANYNNAEHYIKINSKETDPVKVWDNVLFEAQNALNAEVFHALAPEKSSTSDMSFKAYGKAMGTAEYDSVKKYVAALRELILGGLARENLTDLAKSNLAKWDTWDERGISEGERIDDFNNTAHSTAPEKRGTKASLTTAQLYEYEAIEGSEKKHVTGKLKLQIKDIFGPTTTYNSQDDRFIPLRQSVNAGPDAWPATGGKIESRPWKYHQWILNMKSVAALVPPKGGKDDPLTTFKRDFNAILDEADLSGPAVVVAEKNKA